MVPINLAMIVDAKQMRCGACGNRTFEIYTRESHLEIMVECMKCASVSIIKPNKPSLMIDWGEKSDGILCIF